MSDNNKKFFRVIRVALCVLLSLSLVVFCPKFWVGAKSAFASTSSEEKEAEIVALSAKVDSIQNDINKANKMIKEASESRDEAIEKREEAQESYDFARARLEQLKPELQQAATNSYAAYMAMQLLNEIVGNDLVSNAFFKNSLLKIFVSHDDYLVEEILKLYYVQEDSYSEIQEQEKLANKELENSKKAQVELNSSLEQIRAQLNVANSELADIKAYEEKYGKASASRIEGHGKFAHPCPTGTMTSPFGEDRTKEDGTPYFHKGIDFGASEGTPIYAADDGTVIAATYDDGYNGGRGMWVCISHGDGLITQYMHCSHVFVPVGAQVKKGDNIANVGNTGDSQGSHVHFQVEENGTPVDGMKYLND